MSEKEEKKEKEEKEEEKDLLEEIIDSIDCTPENFFNIVDKSTKLNDDELSTVADSFINACVIEGGKTKKKSNGNGTSYGGFTWRTFLEKCRSDLGLKGTDVITEGTKQCAEKWKQWKEQHAKDVGEESGKT